MRTKRRVDGDELGSPQYPRDGGSVTEVRPGWRSTPGLNSLTIGTAPRSQSHPQASPLGLRGEGGDKGENRGVSCYSRVLGETPEPCYQGQWKVALGSGVLVFITLSVVVGVPTLLPFLDLKGNPIVGRFSNEDPAGLASLDPCIVPSHCCVSRTRFLYSSRRVILFCSHQRPWPSLPCRLCYHLFSYLQRFRYRSLLSVRLLVS